jgi:hypothetical protein
MQKLQAPLSVCLSVRARVRMCVCARKKNMPLNSYGAIPDFNEK